MFVGLELFKGLAWINQNRLKIFDTTLRDGQQCPGAGMSFESNLRYARLAHEVGVDVIEAGFPSASEVDFEIVKTIAEDLSPKDSSPIIAGLCQLRDEQVDQTIKSLEIAVPYNKARMHTYVPVDPILMIASLGEKADKEKIIKDVHDFIKRAVGAGLEVEFSPEGLFSPGREFQFRNRSFSRCCRGRE